MPTPIATGLDMAGVLNFLAGVPQPGPLIGPVLAAQSAWPAVNSHGIKAANLDGSMLGALNLKAGTVGLDINLVCNILAGTKGLEACLALRIYAGLP